MGVRLWPGMHNLLSDRFPMKEDAVAADAQASLYSSLHLKHLELEPSHGRSKVTQTLSISIRKVDCLAVDGCSGRWAFFAPAKVLDGEQRGTTVRAFRGSDYTVFSLPDLFGKLPLPDGVAFLKKSLLFLPTSFLLLAHSLGFRLVPGLFLLLLQASLLPGCLGLTLPADPGEQTA
jgi:hypothetical protein